MPDIEALISRWATQDYDLGPTDYESLAENQPQLTTAFLLSHIAISCDLSCRGSSNLAQIHCPLKK